MTGNVRVALGQHKDRSETEGDGQERHQVTLDVLDEVVTNEGHGHLSQDDENQ